MAHSAGKIVNLSAVVLLLLLLQLVATAVAGGRIHGDAASVDVFFPCNPHLSGSYKGACFGLVNDRACRSVCMAESSNNDSGECNFFQCWCTTKCTSETTAAAAASSATAPIPARMKPSARSIIPPL